MDQIQDVTPESVGEHVRAAFGGRPEFRPGAYFDEDLDCIRVRVRDCSVTEWRVSPQLTVLEDNYADEASGRELYVGFTIKGARHFCREHGIDLSVPVKLSKLLDRILAESSEGAVRVTINKIAKPLVEREKSLIDAEVYLPVAA